MGSEDSTGTSQDFRAPASKSVAQGEDVTLAQRETIATNVRNQFDDVFKVTSNCEDVKVDISNYSDDIDISGSLSYKKSVEFFERLGASEFVLKTLREGHYPNLISEVPSFEKRNNISYYQHKEFADGQILELIKKGKVEIVSKKPLILNPLSVAVQRTKLRLILDCSYLNRFIEVPKFKYEDAMDALSYFSKDF